MISALSALWPLLLKLLRWGFDLVLRVAGRKAREAAAPTAPTEPPVEPPATPPTSPTEPAKPVAVTAHDDTSAALAGAAVQSVEGAHANTTRALSDKATAIDAQDLDELAASANNVYQISSKPPQS
jgi:hypothetical protein